MSAIIKLLAALFVLILIIGQCSKKEDGGTEQQAVDAFPTHSCDIGTITSARFYIKKREAPFYLQPDKAKGRVINARATSVLGRTEYRDLWPEMVLQGLCETPEWLQAKIVEADGSPVEWESGWVEKSKVRSDASSDYNAGLIWNIDDESAFTAKEKAVVKEGALKVLRDDPNCAKITTGYRSGSKKGQYYVTCTAKNDGEPFNVWFAPADVKAGKKLSTPTAMSESTSRQLCYDAIKGRVNHPSTLDMHTFTGYATRVANNGNREIIQTFSAKNSFGLELKHEARCLILPDGKVEVTIQEAR